MVCVNHLNRCKTSTWFVGFWGSFILFHVAGGHRRPIELCPTKLSRLITWTYLHSFRNHFRCQFPIFVNGNRLSPEPAWRQLWFSAVSNVHFIFCTVFAICQVENDMALLKGKGQLPIFSNLPWLWRWLLSLFLGSFQGLTPVRFKGIVCARKMHSTTKFAMTVLSKCVLTWHRHIL